MKTLFTFILVFLTLSVFSQIYQKLDSISDHGGLQQKFYYNELNQNTERIVLQWDGASFKFIPKSKNEFIFDTFGNCIKYMYSTYNKSSQLWKNGSKTEMVYDIQNNITQSWYYTWNDSTWKIVDKVDHENSFDSNGCLISKILHYYNADGYRAVYCELKYGAKNEMVSLKYNGDHITDNRIFTIYNDTINNKLEIIQQNFYQFGGYKPKSKTEFLYDKTIDIKDVIKSVDYESHVFPYPYNIYIRNFIAKFQIISEKQYTVVNVDEWKFSNELIFHYKPIAVTGNSIEPYNNTIEVYPNPVKDFVNIEAQYPANFVLYDLNGRTILKVELSGQSKIYIGDLEKGIYLYKVFNNEISRTGKLIKK